MKKRTLKITSLVLAIVMALLTALPLTTLAASSSEQTLGISNYTIHNVGDNTGYYPSSSNKTSTLSSGHTKLGSLSVTGNVSKKNYNGYEAIAVNGGNVTFTYKQTWSNKTYNGNTWYVTSDTATSISGVNVGTIGNGGILILKSFDEGKTWTTATYSTQIDGKSVTYQPSGDDIARGVLLKFISVAEAKYTYVSGRYKDWTSPFTYKWRDSYSDAFDNFAQVTTVYVASDTAQIGYYSTAIDNYDISKDIPDVDADTMEILKLGTTMSNGSVSFDKIRIDKLSNKSFDVRCSFNDSSYFTVADGSVFEEPGRYHFIVTTKFQKQTDITLYIFKPGDDLGYSQYFGNGFVSQDKRVFDKTSKIPVYMVGTTLNLSPNKYTPGVYGNIIRYANAEAVEKNNYEVVKSYDNRTTQSTLTLNQTGIYCADLYVGNPSSGSGQVIRYEFYWQVVNNSEYKPTLNYELLTSATRPINLSTKHYAVNFVTAGGGSYVFVFSENEQGYEQALSFSEEIEKRFVEEYTDAAGNKYYYYKAHGSSGLKERYDSKVELYENLYQYAKENVNLTYTVSTEQYATMTLEEAVKKIETTSITKDVKVTVDTATRDQMVVSDKIINGYKFYQAANYEVERVVATDGNGNLFEISFDTEVDSILPATGFYMITEYNWNGTNSYWVNFIKDEVTGEIKFNASKDLNDFSGKINKNTTDVIEANNITFVSGKDEFDSQTIVTVTKTGFRQNMLLSEVNGYTITEPGVYTVTLTNRCGYTTKATVKITAAPKINAKFEGYASYNTTFEYGEKLGTLPAVTKYGYDFLGWQVNGVNVTSNTICNWKTDVTLTPVFKAKTVQIIFNYFGGYKTTSADFNSIVTLDAVGNIEDVFKFSYWELDGQQLDGTLKVSTLDTIILVAQYVKIEDTQGVSYSAYEVASELANRTNKVPSLKDEVASEPEVEQPEPEQSETEQSETSSFFDNNPMVAAIRNQILNAIKKYLAKFGLAHILVGFSF